MTVRAFFQRLKREAGRGESCKNYVDLREEILLSIDI